MSEEPIYYFVKGKGWVIGEPPAGVREVRVHGQRFRVSFYNRKPTPGEHGWWTVSNKLEQSMDTIINVGYFPSHNAFGWKYDPVERPDVAWSNQPILTIKTEVIDVDR